MTQPKPDVPIESAAEFDVEGLDELLDILDELPKNVRNKALRRATRDVAKVTRDLAVAYAPHDTGLLESAIKVKARMRDRTKIGKATVGTSVMVGEGYFKGKTFYGGFLEFGTTDRVTKSGANRGRLQKGEHDFLRRGLQALPSVKFGMFVESIRNWIASSGWK